MMTDTQIRYVAAFNSAVGLMGFLVGMLAGNYGAAAFALSASCGWLLAASRG